MATVTVSEGEDFVINCVSRAFGGRRLEALRVSGLDGSSLAQGSPILARATDPLNGGASHTAYNVAHLRLLRARADTDTAFLAGYATAGDGGEGYWQWDPASVLADNTGATLAVSGVAVGRWRRSHTEAVEAAWFGALAGGTDELAAIQAALDYANTLRGTSRRVVNICRGTHNVAGTLTVYAGITLQGEPGAELKQATPGTTGAVLITGTSVHGLRLRHLTLTGRTPYGSVYLDNTLYDEGVVLYGNGVDGPGNVVCEDVEIDRCKFQNWTCALRVLDGSERFRLAHTLFTLSGTIVDDIPNRRRSGYVVFDNPITAHTREDYHHALFVGDCTWDNGSVDDANLPLSERGLIIAAPAKDFDIERCHWLNWRHNALIFAGSSVGGGPEITDRVRQGRVKSCTFRHLRGGSARAIYFFNGVQNVEVAYCVFDDIIGDAIHLQNGSHNNNVHHCRFLNVGQFEQKLGAFRIDNALEQSSNNRFEDNYVDTVPGYAVFLAEAPRTVVRRNYITNVSLVNGDAGLGAICLLTDNVSLVDDSRVEGNDIIACGYWGVLVKGRVRNLNITDNCFISTNIKGTGTATIFAQGLTVNATPCVPVAMLVRNNRFEDNVGLGYGTTTRKVVQMDDAVGTMTGLDVRDNTISTISYDLAATALPFDLPAYARRGGNRLAGGALEGVATLVTGTVTISTPEAKLLDTAAPRVVLTPVTGSSTGTLRVANITSSGFDVVSTDAADTRKVFWQIVM